MSVRWKRRRAREIALQMLHELAMRPDLPLEEALRWFPFGEAGRLFPFEERPSGLFRREGMIAVFPVESAPEESEAAPEKEGEIRGEWVRGFLRTPAGEVEEARGLFFPTSADPESVECAGRSLPGFHRDGDFGLREAEELFPFAAAVLEIADYAARLVRGVSEETWSLDTLIRRHMVGWRPERMVTVDRTAVELALYEGWIARLVPVAVAISEAVELAKLFGTEDSGRFVNGVLGRIVRAESGGRSESPEAEPELPGVPEAFSGSSAEPEEVTPGDDAAG